MYWQLGLEVSSIPTSGVQAEAVTQHVGSQLQYFLMDQRNWEYPSDVWAAPSMATSRRILHLSQVSTCIYIPYHFIGRIHFGPLPVGLFSSLWLLLISDALLSQCCMWLLHGHVDVHISLQQVETCRKSLLAYSSLLHRFTFWPTSSWDGFSAEPFWFPPQFRCIAYPPCDHSWSRAVYGFILEMAMST